MSENIILDKWSDKTVEKPLLNGDRLGKVPGAVHVASPAHKKFIFCLTLNICRGRKGKKEGVTWVQPGGRRAAEEGWLSTHPAVHQLPVEPLVEGIYFATFSFKQGWQSMLSGSRDVYEVTSRLCSAHLQVSVSPSSTIRIGLPSRAVTCCLVPSLKMKSHAVIEICVLKREKNINWQHIRPVGGRSCTWWRRGLAWCTLWSAPGNMRVLISKKWNLEIGWLNGHSHKPWNRQEPKDRASVRRPIGEKMQVKKYLWSAAPGFPRCACRSTLSLLRRPPGKWQSWNPYK